MKRFEALLSDADGTLVNSVSLIRHGQYETIVTYLRDHGIPEPELPDYSTFEILLNQIVGGSARDTLELTVKMLFSDRENLVKDIDYSTLHNMLDPIQDRISKNYIKPYNGLSLLLKNLGQEGIKLAIFTSGTSHHIVRNMGIALPELDLTELFKDKSKSDKDKLDIFNKEIENKFSIPIFTVVTIDDTKEAKPHPEGLEIAMQRLGVKPNDCAVLGDHKADMQAGINATVPLRIGVTHGFDDRNALIKAGATEIINRLNQIELSI